MDKEYHNIRFSIIKGQIEDRGGSVEFSESITLIGLYGDRIATKHIFIRDGKLCGHLYNAWVESDCVVIENVPLTDETYVRLENLTK